MPCIVGTYIYKYTTLFRMGSQKETGEPSPPRAVTAIQAADTDTYFYLVKVL